MAVSAKTEFDIAAPLSVVMEVLMDVESLPEWSGPHKAAQIVSTHDDGTPDEVKEFQECFLTGTAVEVTPVAEAGEYRFTPGALSLDLMDHYGKLVRGQL